MSTHVRSSIKWTAVSTTVCHINMFSLHGGISGSVVDDLLFIVALIVCCGSMLDL